MSGAEVILGVASAAVGFASLSIQLIDSAQKLKAFCDAFRNAPEHIHDIYQSLQTLAQSLEELAQSSSEADGPNAAQTLLDRCIAQCRVYATRISSTVESIGLCIIRYRKMGRLYMAFKDRDIERLFATLERYKSDLHSAAFTFRFSQQQRQLNQLRDIVVHSSRLTTNQLNIISANLKSITSTHVDPLCAEHKTAQKPLIRPSKRQEKNYSLRMKLKIPHSWLSRKVFEIAMLQTRCGWDWRVVSYNSRPPDSPLFVACRSGDIETIKLLIESREASLLDVETGSNMFPDSDLLSIAAGCRQYDVVHWLFRQGIHMYLTAESVKGALNEMCSMFNLMELESDGPISTTYSRFLELEQDIDLDMTDFVVNSDHPRYGWFTSAPTIACRRTALQSIWPPLDTYGVYDRLLWLAFSAPTRPTYRKRIPFDHEDIMTHDELEQAIDDCAGARAILAVTSRVFLYITEHVKLETWNLWRSFALRALQKHNHAWMEILGLCESPENTSPVHYSLIMYLSIFDGTVTTAINDRLSDWINLIQEAGIVAEDYINAQNDDMEQSNMSRRQFSNGRNGLIPHALLYELRSKRCELLLRRPDSFTVYKRITMPGGFDTPSPWLPCHIIWPPTRKEKQEGGWEVVQVHQVCSEPFAVKDHHVPSLVEPRLLDPKDDCGIFVRMLTRKPANLGARKRSASETRQWSLEDGNMFFLQSQVYGRIQRHPVRGDLRFCKHYFGFDRDDHRYGHMNECDNHDFLADYLGSMTSAMN